MLHYSHTPTQAITHPLFTEKGLSLLVKREDQNHPAISGNKWWKLKYNLEAARKSQQNTLLTFGGAYSNHIYATAAAAAELGLRAIGVIRGEEPKMPSTTLKFAAQQGMELHFVSREAYRKKNDPDFLDLLRKRFGNFFLIPEGGANALAVRGCAEFAKEELSTIDFDHLFLAVGTGGTMAGLVCGLDASKKITGIPVLKNGSFLENEIRKLVSESCGSKHMNWSLKNQYHHGGYAKTTPQLLAFMKEMQDYGLPLDHVYTAKVMWAILKEAESDNFKPGERILMLHTGGLQGSLKLP